jgi:putative FmdB family regulatory protein
MPIYEYQCLKCQQEFEELVFGSSPEIQCPACQATEVKRLLSVTALKTGNGFIRGCPFGGLPPGLGSGSLAPSRTPPPSCGRLRRVRTGQNHASPDGLVGGQ